MNINVRVVSRAAQTQIKQLQGQVAALEGELAKANRTQAGFGGRLGSGAALTKWGNQLQWSGRQLQYNFTLPLLLAGGAATKWAMDNEKAFTHVRKVYGDTAAATAYFNKHQKQIPAGMNASEAATASFNSELTALRKSFVAMSSHYGVAQKDVLNVAGAWAAAGKSGVELAKGVNLTMQAMILGDMDATKATDALISIQAQYGESTQGLARDLAYMNAIENQTAISLPGLIEGFQRSAGVARAAGIDVRHLGALLAALTPAAGSASQAGNALKTVISRLLSPTKEANQVMEAAGIQINKTAWQSANAKDRLFQLSDAFQKMSAGQRNVAASVIASRWQINKFDVLMLALKNHQSMYYQALSATASKTKAFQIQQKELNAVLNSSPRRLQIIWQTMKNGAADAIQPLIPYILYLANLFKELVVRFSNLNPSAQKFFLLLALGLALVGPFARYMGSLALLLGTVSKAFVFLSGAVNLSVLSFLTWPFKAVLAMFGGMFARIFMMFRLLPVIAVGAISLTARAVGGIQIISGIFMAAGRGLIAIWAGTWAAVRGILLVAMTQLKVIQAGTVAFGVGLWSANRYIMQALFLGMSRSLLAIWRAFASSFVVISGLASKEAVIAFVKAPVRLLVAGASALAGAISLPWTIAIAAVIALVAVFHKQIAEIWNNITQYFANSQNGLVKSLIGAWNLLPKGVQGALAAVVRIVHDAAMEVYKWFSYLNPFAHHSPSLVENVQGGMAKVGTHLATVKDSKKHFDSAHQSIENYGAAAATAAPDVSARRKAPTGNPGTSAIQHLISSADHATRSANQAMIKKIDPKAAAAYAELGKRLDALTPKLNVLNAAVVKQQKVVDAAQAAVDKWNSKIDAAQKKLDDLQKVASDWNDKLTAAQDALSSYASAPIKGMQAMDDQIQANSMAQKKLQYQMMQMTKVTGTLDDVKNKMALINGQQELMQGQKMDLVAAGAGSEITGVFDKQIAGLQDTKKQYSVNMQALQDMQDALDSLQQKADELDLEKSLKFDDLTYQIQKAANTTKELSFDQIMAGIKKSKDEIALYTDKVNDANAAVAKQQAVVDNLTASRDKAQTVLDAEQAKLDTAKQKYDDLNTSIQNIKQTMDDAASAAQNLQQILDSKKDKKDKKKPHKPPKGPEDTIGLQNFKNAAKANFPDVGGAGKAMRTDWKSQADQIDKFTNDLSKKTAGMFGDLNPFAPIRKKWNEFVAWLKKEWSALKPGLSDFFGKVFDGIKMPAALGGSAKKIGNVFDGVKKTAESFGAWAAKWGKRIWALLGPDIVDFLKNAWDGIKSIFDQVSPEIVKFGKAFGPTGKVLKDLWALVQPILIALGGSFLALAKIVLSVLATTIKPVLQTIGVLLAGVLSVIRGVVEVVVGLLTGDWRTAWQGMVDIVVGTIKILVGVFAGPIAIITGIIEGLVKGIYGFFKWLYDVLVGHSIVPDMIDGIIAVFKLLIAVPKWIWDNVLKPIYDFFVSVWKDYIKPFISQWWGWIKTSLSDLFKLGQWVWDNVLKPVWNWFHDLWADYVKPALDQWWSWIKSAWSGLLNAGQWVWDNVLKPVWNWFHDLWTKYIEPALGQWWSWIQTAWADLKKLGGWFWDNILSPVLDKVKSLWTDHVQPNLASWWDKLTKVWDNLTGLKDWFWSNVLKPIKDKFTDAFNDIKDWFTNNQSKILHPIQGVAKAIADAINWVIRGINKLSNLPGLSFHIDEINVPDSWAKGGIPRRRVGSGFKTNGARAIVGEGKQNYPEYVIPTDPTYRKRAQSLLQQASGKIGMSAIPMHASGGILGGIPGVGDAIGAIKGLANGAKDAVTGSLDWIKGNVEKLASDLAMPLLNKGKDLIDSHVDWKYARMAADSAIDQVKNWITQADSVYADKAKAAQAASTAGGGSYQPYTPGGSAPWARVSFRGFSMDAGQVQAILAAEKEYGGQFHITQGSYSTSVAASGSTHSGGGAFDMTSPVNNGALAALRHHGQAAWIRSPSQGPWPWHIHSLMIGDPNLSASARGQVMSFLAGGDGLAKGGIVRASRGGTRKLLAEAGHDEAVIPLPLGWKNSSTSSSTNEETHLHFHGDLSFPNIKSGEDAETLIANLKSLAGGAA